MTYRRDIDGLRALAVLSVIFFHAGFTQVRGGFAGVDVFFVISGYLITLYIDQRVTAGQFSIVEFYERRARRILPALFFLLMCCALASAIILLPSDLVKFSKSLAASVAFVPNVHFYSLGGYFDDAAKSKPLLHLWSLGVEEQFYLVFPLFIAVFARFGRRLLISAVIGATVISFVLSVVAVAHHGREAFFLVHFRAWELLLGSLIALKVFPSLNAPLRATLSLAGLALVCASFFVLSEASPFPGFGALLPCVGAAMVIYSGEQGSTPAGLILGSPPLVAVGLISYSLYLWHWPTLVFVHYALDREPSKVLVVGLIAGAMAVSVLSWWFVERPFRLRTIGATRRGLFIQSAAIAAVLLAGAAAGIVSNGLPGRFAPIVARYDAAARTDNGDYNTCLQRMSAEKVRSEKLCPLNPLAATPPHVVLWGDSHAAAIEPALKALAVQTKTNGWFAGRPACGPLLGVGTDKTHDQCRLFNDAMLAFIVQNRISHVVLSARWDLYMFGWTAYDLAEGNRSTLRILDDETVSASDAENSRVLERGLRRTLEALRRQNITVFLALDPPYTNLKTPRFLAREARAGHLGTVVTLDLPDDQRRKASARAFLSRIAADYQVAVLDPWPRFCDGARCLIAKEGLSLYKDADHLTDFGAQQLTGLFAAVFGAPKKALP